MRVTPEYKGRYTMDSHATMALSFSLFIVECMVVWYASFGHSGFFKPAAAALGIWIVGFICAVSTNKKFMVGRNSLV